MNEHKNTILAIVLSLIVVVGWEYFFAKPELQQQQAQHQTQTKPGAGPSEAPPATPGAESGNAGRTIGATAHQNARGGDHRLTAHRHRYAPVARQRRPQRRAD